VLVGSVDIGELDRIFGYYKEKMDYFGDYYFWIWDLLKMFDLGLLFR